MIHKEQLDAAMAGLYSLATKFDFTEEELIRYGDEVLEIADLITRFTEEAQAISEKVQAKAEAQRSH